MEWENMGTETRTANRLIGSHFHIKSPIIHFVFLVTLFLVLVNVPAVYGQDEQADEEDIGMFALPFEEAMDIEVISVTRSEGQDVFTSPAAIYVITQEDIRRSGLDSVPELFRLVPGIHVGKVGSNLWSISIRGLFPSRANNKALVMIDGRAIYSPSFGGVYWDVQDVPLEIIDRIEVVRGPGGMLWGANAVNGVINIITKKAEETQGGTLTLGGGTEHRASSSVIYGGKSGEKGFYRVYGKWDLYDDFNFADGSDARDPWHLGKGGYRFDWLDGTDSFTLQGDAYHSHLGFRPISSSGEHTRTHVYGTNVLGKWQRRIDEETSMHLQFYYDMTSRLSGEVDEQRHTGDIEFVHSFVPFEGHKMTWGLGYNIYTDERRRTFYADWANHIMTKQTFSGFVQDSFDLAPDLLNFTFGTKLERNQFTGFEYQPSMRLAYTPNEKHMYWTAVSRSVRTPMLLEDDVILGGGAILSPNKDLESEVVTSYELGYRYRPSHKFFLDLTMFTNFHDGLIADTPQKIRKNVSDGLTHGVEVAANWQAAENWRLEGNYSFAHIQMKNVENNLNGDFWEGTYPKNMAGLTSYMDISDKLEFNTAFYYTDHLPLRPVHSRARLDIGFTYKPRENFEISIWGQNLLEPQDLEMTATSGPDIVEAERAIFAKATWRF